MQGYFEMPEIRVAALLWDMEVVYQNLNPCF